MTNIRGTNLRWYSYRDKTRELEICFRRNGKRYLYQDVPEEAYLEVLTADSAGRAFNKHIRGKYSYKELTPIVMK
jgi:lysyl-tRNA synthetase class 2